MARGPMWEAHPTSPTTFAIVRVRDLYDRWGRKIPPFAPRLEGELVREPTEEPERERP